MKTLYKVMAGMLFGMSVQVYASPEQEQLYLVQLLNQLDALTPTLLAAQQEEPKNQRVQFHYTAWRDSHGQMHNGVLEDIKTIKQGILEKLNNTAIEPRVVKPISADYLDKQS